MNDLISRCQLFNRLATVQTIGEAYGVIQGMPTVDAVPVVHGQWKEDPSGYGFWICSACGFVSEASAADMLYKFCPVCGAKMDGKDGEHHEKAD